MKLKFSSSNILVALMLTIGIVALSTPSFSQDLAANVDVNIAASNFTYTLDNLESVDGPNYITSFYVSVAAPVDVVSTPAGWDFSTDNSTFVYWYNTDPSLPYPHDVAPGTSLSGFTIESTTSNTENLDFGVFSWDHSQDVPGLSTSGSVPAPALPVPAPELSCCQMFGSTLLVGIIFLNVKKRKSAI